MSNQQITQVAPFTVKYNNNIVAICKTEQDARLIKKFIIQHPDKYFNTLTYLSQINKNNFDTVDSFIKKVTPYINASTAQKIKKHNLVKDYLRHWYLQIKCTSTNDVIHLIQTKLPEQAIIEHFELDNKLFNNTLLTKVNQEYAWFEIICKNRFHLVINKYIDNISIITVELFQQIEHEINQLLQLHGYSSLQDMWLEYVNNDFKMKISF